MQKCICSAYGSSSDYSCHHTIIDAPATMLNATGDNTSAMLVSRAVEGKDWLDKEEAYVINDSRGSTAV